MQNKSFDRLLLDFFSDFHPIEKYFRNSIEIFTFEEVEHRYAQGLPNRYYILILRRNFETTFRSTKVSKENSEFLCVKHPQRELRIEDKSEEPKE